MEFKIFFEDQHLIVLSKPAGLLSQSDSSQELSLVDHLRTHFGRNYVGLIHRIDRNTSGLMVVGKRSKAAQRLTEALQNGELKRDYRALLHGTLSPGISIWRDYLLKSEELNRSRVVSESTPGAKKAVLSVKPITTRFTKKKEPITLAEFSLETGRSHQIRVQAAHRKLPLVGDHKYDPDFKLRNYTRCALHSHFIQFPHPMTHETLQFIDELPDDLAAYWQNLSGR